MKWILCGVFISLLLASSMLPIVDGCGMQRPREKLGMYDGYATPAWILRGLAMVETGERDRAVGDGGLSRGRMQLNEKYHSERGAAWGSYDPEYPNDSIRIASCLFQNNLKILKSIPKAISAHKWGWWGVRKYGVDSWYVMEVAIYGHLR